MSFFLSSNSNSLQRLSSDLSELHLFNASSFRNVQDLPLEILEIVASYLRGADLENLSHVSSKFKGAALHEKNVQQMHLAIEQLALLANLKPTAAIRGSSALDVYLNFLDALGDEELLEVFSWAAIKPAALKQLKQTLTALSTQQVAEEFLALSLECFEEIRSRTWCNHCIESKYQMKKTQCIVQALDHVISHTRDPKKARGYAVKQAALKGHLKMVQALLEHEDISIEDRNEAVALAAEKGSLVVVRALLENQKIVQEDLQGLALWEAVKKGHVENVEALLESGSISDRYLGWIVVDLARKGCLELIRMLLANSKMPDKKRGEAVIEAVKNKRLEVVEALLESGACIFEEDRGWAVGIAAQNGLVEILQALLADGACISEVDRGWALQEAVEHDRLEVARVLLGNGKISEHIRASILEIVIEKGHLNLVQDLMAYGPILDAFRERGIVLAAAKRGHLEIVKHLLANMRLSDELRGDAVLASAEQGHLDVVKAFLENGSISKNDRYSAIQRALEHGHNALSNFLMHQLF